MYFNVDIKHEFKNILCGRLVADNFTHMERLIGIHVLIIVERGVLNIEIGGGRYKVRPGEMIILPANVLHKGFSDADSAGHIEYFWAHFLFENNFEISEDTANNAKAGAGGEKDGFGIPMYFKLNDFPRARILYNQLLDVYRLTGTRQKYCDFLFTALCCEAAAQAERESVTGNKTVNSAAAWIELNIDAPISLETAAAALGYNKRYLSRLFKEYTGMTVNEFITDKKMTLAKELLTGSDESVSSIAQKIGYSDAGYFMRVFKKREGMTCREYRGAYSKMYLNKK